MAMTDASEYSGVERENRTWVALSCGQTKENDTLILHNFSMLKFEMPDNAVTRGRNLTNCQQDAIWFYLNHLDSYSTMSNDRMINASDLPEQVLEAIQYRNIPFTGKPATIETYIEKELYGYKTPEAV